MSRSGDKPVVYILAEPNGSGKSTFYSSVLSRWISVFVNADQIAAEMSPGNVDAVAWDAARMAGRGRTEMLATGRHFATETVFSHPSKLEFIEEAKAAGYYVRMLFFCLEDPSLNIGRVALRVERGGHDVPGDRIASRYFRALELAVKARNIAGELWLFDNSERGRAPRRVARFVGGRLTALRGPLPGWVAKSFGELILDE